MNNNNQVKDAEKKSDKLFGFLKDLPIFKNELFAEFMRYAVVGGLAFIVDFSLLFLFQHYVFFSLADTGVYISTSLGFIGGLIFNYILSLIFVFQSAKEKDCGKSVGAFIVFAIVGVIGLLLTEFGMFLGVSLLSVNYLIVKIFVTVLVLIWNYGARKLLLFR